MGGRECSPRQRQDKDEKSFLGANLFRKVIPSSASSPLMVAAKGKEQGYYCFRLDGWLVGGNCYGRWILDTFLSPLVDLFPSICSCGVEDGNETNSTVEFIDFMSHPILL